VSGADAGSFAAPLNELDWNAKRIDIALDPQQIKHLGAYAEMVWEANKRTNLTGAKSPEALVRLLLLDSLVLWSALPEECRTADAVRVVDLGAGAGVPGVPLAVMRPDWHVTLIDSAAKKTAFLATLPDVLALPRLSVVTGRAEEIAGQPRFRDAFDLVVARALAPLPSLLELSAPFAEPGALLAFPKSGAIHDEIDRASHAAHVLHVRLDRVEPVPKELGLGEGRATVLYRKTEPTPPGYPRRTGLAQSRPLAAP
jgi:16S rRNA (guanine527-N7)-methyltransferase